MGGVFRSLPRWVRVTSYVGIGTALVLIAGFISVVWTVHRSFPQTPGRSRSTGSAVPSP